MEPFDYCIVDTFSSKPYQGNPTGVVFDADRLAAGALQRIAEEINRSQTAFVYGANMPDHHFGLRWFSPKGEVPFSGHGTIAAVYGMLQTDRLPAEQHKGRQPIYIDSQAGLLTARVEYVGSQSGEASDPIIWLRVPRPRLTERTLSATGLRSALRLDESVLPALLKVAMTEQSDVIIPVPELDLLLSVEPDFYLLAQWCRRHDIRGVCAVCTKALDRSLDCHSRFFSPAVGINEEPVTGCIHGPLGLWLVQKGHVRLDAQRMAAMKCVQSDSSGRVGLVHVIVQDLAAEGWVALIAGCSAMTMAGRLSAPVASA